MRISPWFRSGVSLWDRGLAGGLDFLLNGPVLGLPSGLPVFRGTCFAPDPVGDSGGLGSPCIAPVAWLLPALPGRRGDVAPSAPASGTAVGRTSAGFRIWLRPRPELAWAGASVSGPLQLPFWGLAARCFIGRWRSASSMAWSRQRECVLESSAYCTWMRGLRWG